MQVCNVSSIFKSKIGIVKNVNFFSKFSGNEGDGFELNATQSNFSISIVLTQSGFQAVGKKEDAQKS